MIDVIDCTLLIQNYFKKESKMILFDLPKTVRFDPKTVRFRSQREGQNVKVYFPKMCSPLQPGAIFRNPTASDKGLLRRHFGVTLRTLGSIWAYESGFGAPCNRMATTLKSLWICDRPFSKNTFAQ